MLLKLRRALFKIFLFALKFLSLVQRTFQLASECVGVVATLVSKDNEPTAEFTNAAEAWRVGP